MDFSWTPEQTELRNQVVKFAQTELSQNVIERDLNLEFSREDWQKCADFGIQGLAIPKKYGGQGHDLMTATYMMDGLGYGCRDNGLTFALNSSFVSTAKVLLDEGTEAQKQKYLRGMCTGELIGAYAMTEPDAGSDAFSIQTLATETDGGYILNGKKVLLTLGPIADFVVVFATVNPDLRQWGITVFIVDKDTPGFTATETMPKMGLRTTPIGELTLDNCFVPAENMVGEEGSGAAIFSLSQTLERAGILASQLGIMEYQLEQAIKYATTREQFGRPISKFQAVSHRIADMRLRLDVARLLSYRAIWMIQEEKSAALEASLANIYMSESFIASSMDAIMVHGGRGYLTDHEVERDMRDAIGGPVYGGTSDIQKNIVAKNLGL